MTIQIGDPCPQPGCDSRILIFDPAETVGYCGRDHAITLSANGANDPDDGERPIGNIISLADLVTSEFPEPTWAVDGIFAEGLNVLAGAPKIGKSFLLLGVGIAVAAGGVALGSIRVDAGDVLYLALEDTRRRIKERSLQIIGDGSVPLNLYVATTWPRMHEGFEEQMADFLAAHPNTRLVLIDTYIRIRPAKPPNVKEYDFDYDVGSELRDFANARRVPFVAAHHTRESAADDPLDTMYGSRGLTGAANLPLIFKRSVGRSDATLYLRGHDIEEAEYALNFDPAMCHWSLMGDASEARLSEQRATILAVLRTSEEGLTPKQIADETSMKPGNVRFLLSQMVKNAQVMGNSGCYTAPR